MEWFSAIDWDKILIPDTPLLEIFLRGSLMYLFVFILLRGILKRQAGSVGITDLLVLVLIADAAQNAMADDYKSVPDGILLVSTIVFWNWFLEWLAFHWPWFEKLIHPGPLMIVRHGRMIRDHMGRELLTEEDLMCQLRLQGIEKLNEVKHAYMEGDGKISIIKKDGSQSRKSTDTPAQ